MTDIQAVSFSGKVEGGTFAFLLSCDSASVDTLCNTAVSLGALYGLHAIITRIIDSIVKIAMGGERDDQEISETRQSSLRVVLNCFTDKRFVDVWQEFQSGVILDRFQKGFEDNQIKVEGLKIIIKNIEDVEKKIKELKDRNSPSIIDDVEKMQERNLVGPVSKKQKLDYELHIEQLETKLMNKFEENFQSFQSFQKTFQSFQKTVLNELEKIRPSTTVHKQSDWKGYIIVLGGQNHDDWLTSVESLSLTEKYDGWEMLPSMTKIKQFFSVVVIESKVCVIGDSDCIEMMDMALNPFKWIELDAKLPFISRGHTAVEHQKKIIFIGGYNVTKGSYSDEVYGISLFEPYSSELLCKLPRRMAFHCSVKVNSKVFTFGGSNDNGIYDDVIVLDLKTNSCKMVSKLPYPCKKMTPLLRDEKIFLLGGESACNIRKDTIAQFDIKTNSCGPVMETAKAKYGCAAVVNEEVNVVLGGFNKNGAPTNEVCRYNHNFFELGGWVPNFNEARGNHVAVSCLFN